VRRRRARGSADTCPPSTSRRTRRISSRVAGSRRSRRHRCSGDHRTWGSTTWRSTHVGLGPLSQTDGVLHHLEGHREDLGAGSVGAADIEAQSAWIISAWNSLVSARKEFGRLSTPARTEMRRTSIAGSSVTIHALIGAMSTMYLDSLDPSAEFPKLAQQDDEDVDFFDLENPDLGGGAAKQIAERLGIAVPNVG
jgi:hypothetical protein